MAPSVASRSDPHAAFSEAWAEERAADAVRDACEGAGASAASISCRHPDVLILPALARMCFQHVSAAFIYMHLLYMRVWYVGTSGGEGPIKKRSLLKFEWLVSFPDGSTEAEQIQMRADEVKSSGVKRPSRLAVVCGKKARATKYSAAGALALAEAATRQAQSILGQHCASVACERPYVDHMNAYENVSARAVR